MAIKILLAVALVLDVTNAGAQLSSRTFGGIPLWADSALRTAGLDQQFRLSSVLNPVFEFGDLDRDGLVDLVVEIKDSGALRCGIAIVRAIDRSVYIVGAGQPVGNGKDWLPCGGSWGVVSPRHRHGAAYDLLYVSPRGGPSGWLVWDGRGYVWVQADSGGA